jgi:shikimate dehydrogenase
MIHPNSITGLILIIGDPVAHSLSPTMHNAAYQGVTASPPLNLRMLAARVSPSELKNAVLGARALEVHGLAVTMPHKVAIREYLDTIDSTAQKIGAVNTVTNKDGTLTGYNTDWLGVINPIKHRSTLRGKRVAVVGAGGAAQAAVYGCSAEGAQVTIINRTLDKAVALADHFGATPQTLTEQSDLSGYDVIINATSVGMGAESTAVPFDTSKLMAGQIVFETIYHPRRTPLLRDAAARGALVIEGLEMLVEQAIAQFELHTGHPAPRDVMREAIGLSESA